MGLTERESPRHRRAICGRHCLFRWVAREEAGDREERAHLHRSREGEPNRETEAYGGKLERERERKREGERGKRQKIKRELGRATDGHK